MNGRAIGRALVLFVLSISAAFPAVAEIVLKTVAGPHAPPRFNEVEHDGKKVVTGLCIDIMRAIEKADPEIRFVGDQVSMPQARMLAMLQSGEVDVSFCMAKNAERSKIFQFAEPPLFELNYLLAVRANDNVSVHSFEDIRKLGGQGVILVNFGTASVQFLEAIGGLTIDSTGRTQKDNLRKLIAGSGRFYYRHDLGLKWELEASGFTKDVRILPTVFDKRGHYIVFSKSTDPAAIERVQKALVKLKTSGELARLRAKY